MQYRFYFASPNIGLQPHESHVRAYTYGARPCGARQRPWIKSTPTPPRNPDAVTRPTRTGTARTNRCLLRIRERTRVVKHFTWDPSGWRIVAYRLGTK